jgi:hypothetical protein
VETIKTKEKTADSISIQKPLFISSMVCKSKSEANLNKHKSRTGSNRGLESYKTCIFYKKRHFLKVLKLIISLLNQKFKGLSGFLD